VRTRQWRIEIQPRRSLCNSDLAVATRIRELSHALRADAARRLQCALLRPLPPRRLDRNPFKAALVGDGIPFTSFAVDDVQKEFERLSQLGVRFTQDPARIGPVTTAVFDDTWGNLIQIAQQN
jgi:hypothetical protein